MRSKQNLFWIYTNSPTIIIITAVIAIICGCNGVVSTTVTGEVAVEPPASESIPEGEEFRPGKYIVSNDDFASINSDSLAENELQTVYIREIPNRNSVPAVTNDSRSDERWSYTEVRNNENGASADPELTQRNENTLSDSRPDVVQRKQKKRVKGRRRKVGRRNNNGTEPVTKLTALATIIDNSGTGNGDIVTTRMEVQKLRNPTARRKRVRKHRKIKTSTEAQPGLKREFSQEHTWISDGSVGPQLNQSKPSTSSSLEDNSVDRTDSKSSPADGGSKMKMRRKIKRTRAGRPALTEQQRKLQQQRRLERMRLKEEERKQKLAAREEKRKLLQAKRQSRGKKKMERLLRNQNKLNLNAVSSTEKSNHIEEGNGNSLNESPSIDYYVEKSSNYLDVNETVVPFQMIGVSMENPSNILSIVEIPDDSSNLSSDSVEQIPAHIVDVKPTSGHQLDVNLNHRTENYADMNDKLPEMPDNSLEEKEKENQNTERGDLSCFKNYFTPAPVVSHSDIKYLRNDLEGVENAFLEVEYICHHGYRLEYKNHKASTNVYCKNGTWIGERPSCVRVKDLKSVNETCNYPQQCDHLCFVKDGEEVCSCHKGFRNKNNRCEDINECLENIAICEYGCVNTVGSYRCKCPQGLRTGEANSCIDVNECLLRNGHGPCQDTCINTWGSYKCSCDSLTGSRLNPDGHSCEDLDECSVNNGGCSHTCLNTMGRAFCLCPEGWVLDKDWKTCVDIDECAESKFENLRCEFGCINTPGSYSCLLDFRADQPIDELEDPECPDGYYRNYTTADCQDINECLENNGGCFDHCVNTIGSFHCICRAGYIFAPDKYTCITTNSTTDVSCPPLFPPRHGYLECSRPIASDIVGGDNNGFGGRRRITNRPGSQCVLRCPTGFRINGKFSKQCSPTGEWVGDSDGTCIRYPKPKLICPTDIVLETPPNETMAKLRIPRPKTDVNYDRDVTISPEWVRNSEIALEIGIKNITYTARHPVSKLIVSCTFTINVLEGEPPVVKFCPETQKYSLSKKYDSIKINWSEPVFTDNVNVTDVSRTNSPGNSFAVGSHQIVYIAKDQAGYSARCVFKLLVNVPYRQTLNHPLPIYHMFYK